MYEHAAEIQKRLNYRDFTGRKWGREFRSFLYGRAWTHAEGPVALFNQAVTWLRRLPELSRRRVSQKPLRPDDIDADLVPGVWRWAVFPHRRLPVGAVDRDSYVLCVLERPHEARCVAALSSLSRRSGGPTRAPSCWTAPTGRRCASSGTPPPPGADVSPASSRVKTR